MNDFNFDTNFSFELDNNSGKDRSEVITDNKKTHRRTTQCLELSTKYEYKRAYSEVKLLEALKYEPLKKDHSYNFITGGDVDSLTYLKIVLNEQSLEHCLFSTWCMAAEDIFQFELWIQQGKIKKLDAYVGEIFPNSYKIEYQMLKQMFEKYKCGRIAVFKNHSKIYAGYGEKFYFGIQTSANINTNPRTENGCITINEKIYHFYNDYFNGINSFE
jgi:hypothetical protein